MTNSSLTTSKSGSPISDDAQSELRNVKCLKSPTGEPPLCPLAKPKHPEFMTLDTIVLLRVSTINMPVPDRCDKSRLRASGELK